MATLVAVTDISGGNVTFDLTTSVTHDNVHIEFIRTSDGMQLAAFDEAPSASITVAFTATDGVDLVVILMNIGTLVEAAPCIHLEGPDFGELATYIRFKHEVVAQSYNVYAIDLAGTSTLLGNTEFLTFRDTTAYVDDAASGEIRYQVAPVTDDEERGLAILTERVRHAIPTCLVHGELGDLFGQSHYGRTAIFRPMDLLRGQIRGHRRQMLHTRFMTFRQIETSINRNGKFGAYLVQDAKVTMDLDDGNFFTDFAVPRTAIANLADMVLVPRFKSDTHG